MSQPRRAGEKKNRSPDYLKTRLAMKIRAAIAGWIRAFRLFNL
jgi:hypothetical protein